MKLVVLYRPNSEHAREVESFAHDYLRFRGQSRIELTSVDTREGAAIASLYDIAQYPCILALQEDGQVVQMWQGALPLMDEISAYTYA